MLSLMEVAAVADPAQFDHDRLGHLLSDRLLKVPRFQRSYAWDGSNVEEFIDDLESARNAGNSYFMGTIVLAEDAEDPTRQLIVDGQQRLTTTAVLLAAIRDRLRDVGREDLADSVDQKYLQAFELDQEERVTRLVPNPVDVVTYESMLGGKLDTAQSVALVRSYELCRRYTERVAPTATQYRELVNIVTQLDKDVQVLLAVAANVSEAYVIFETLNDRGADLTTADLLKNYLFSQAGAYLAAVEGAWSRISGRFDRPDDLVKFIRHDYSSRNGKATNRQLYKSLQRNIGSGPRRVLDYLTRLEKSLDVYLALRDPDHPRWQALSFDVRDSLLAYRRFGFESSMPLLLAAADLWSDERAGRLINKVAAWSVRAVVAGRLGGGQAEEAFCEGALAVATGQAQTQDKVRDKLTRIIPDDTDFAQAFLNYGAITSTRAKYLLACLERQLVASQGGGTEALPDWSSKAVTIEHICARSSSRDVFDSDQDYDRFRATRDSLQNLTLIERTINRGLDDKPFVEKRETYLRSRFALTRELGQVDEWSITNADSRGRALARLAVSAWQM
ncbi:DUF262 domain-containing protein [Micromonospora sp. NPDC048898]|uniref:DUF262 domain-containing protein n=1 Tax=Micromonospora sp. NPDC048898 TaxID=3364260 RepID=UPI00371034E1